MSNIIFNMIIYKETGDRISLMTSTADTLAPKYYSLRSKLEVVLALLDS